MQEGVHVDSGMPSMYLGAVPVLRCSNVVMHMSYSNNKQEIQNSCSLKYLCNLRDLL